MIQPNELRIGNWVKFSEYEHYSQLTIVRGTLAKSAEPIPLTEELLLKIGFKKFAYSFVWGTITITESGNGWFLHIDNDRRETAIALPINYLHELQNAYYLVTKEELEVKL